MSLQLTGILHQVGQTEQISDKFQKRAFVIKTQEGKFEEFPQLELVQDKCDQIDRFKIGQEVLVSFNVRGREYTSKKTGEISYFTSLQAWRIEGAAQGVDNGVAGAQNAQNAYPVYDEPSDLPF